MSTRILRIAIATAFLVSGIAGARPQQNIPYRVHAKIGFASEQLLTEHYRKHGREFGKITREEYLLMAQDLRDRPLDMKILESVRRDRVITRFDRRAKAFIAFERNLIIRTFFKPADGEKYFHRQLRSARRRR
jgi:pyocin large subunit-like protein